MIIVYVFTNMKCVRKRKPKLVSHCIHVLFDTKLSFPDHTKANAGGVSFLAPVSLRSCVTVLYMVNVPLLQASIKAV